MNKHEYRDYPSAHRHPMNSTLVEFVAYERLDGTWDVYVFEPPGGCPELEAERVDENHIFIRHITSSDDFERVVTQTEKWLGDEYALVPYYRETGTRKTIQRIFDHLKNNGATRMAVSAVSEAVWELRIRKKDFALAEEITTSNVRAAA